MSHDIKHKPSTLTFNPLDSEEFRRQGYMVIDFLTEYYKTIEKYPVRSQVEPDYLQNRLPKFAPDDPEPIETILRDIHNDIIPGLSHWQSPNHYAYYPCSTSIAGVLGETLAAGFSVVGFHWISSPAATELENIVMDWLANMLNLPKSFTFSEGQGGGGVMMGTTCEALIATITAARDRVLNQIGRDNINKVVIYGSDQTHSSSFKSAKIVGISPNNFRNVKTTRAHAFALQPEALRAAIHSDAKKGTTSTSAVDPIAELSEVAKEYNMWVHVDAAYAGSICICPEFRRVINGVESIDSFSFNAHKWFLAALDCCCVWVKDSSALTKTLSSNPEFLKNKATESQQVVDYKDWQIALSRRFRSLKMWLVVRSYGVNYLRSFLRSHIHMAVYFEEMVVMDRRFEIVVPRNFALVCFRLFPFAVLSHGQKFLEDESLNELNADLLESINSAGRIYMTHTLVEGIFVLRFAVGSTLTQTRHVLSAWREIQDQADRILARKMQLWGCSSS
ncbi:hypothetical protein Cgig2_017554 [Carnegiea gigantea]|uniref:Tyrosine decarboxylase n=1 Tax=Carnegiea gigantea TaxID=171969 RepID=A0A9Q1QKU3_9CARY|nr:hypothetical protein Cgig2_017554 [Carnegiea gigantea]